MAGAEACFLNGSVNYGLSVIKRENSSRLKVESQRNHVGFQLPTLSFQITFMSGGDKPHVMKVKAGIR